MVEGQPPCGGVQSCLGWKLLLSEHSWAHFTGGRLRPWAPWALSPDPGLASRCHGPAVPLAMSQSLRGCAPESSCPGSKPTCDQMGDPGPDTTPLSLCSRKGKTCPSGKLCKLTLFAFIHLLNKWILSPYCVPGAVLNTGDTEGTILSSRTGILVAQIDTKHVSQSLESQGMISALRKHSRQRRKMNGVVV